MAISIGSVAVDVVPSAEGLREKINAIVKDITAHVRLVLDSGEAEAKVESIRLSLDEIRDKHVDVHVDDNGSAARTRASIDSIGDGVGGVNLKVAAIGVGLLALIPIAAAASVAVAGIGAGLGLGIAGLLVGKLALGGVGNALSASNTPTGGSGQSAAQRLDQQRQAEVALTVAQRNATQAQKDLTQARIDAVNNLQNLTDQVADNALSQRQAALDLITAQQNLATAKANPDSRNPANSTALAQVQLAYDQAKQNVQDLTDAGSQLQQQQTAAVAAGVDGAASVVAATNQVTDSQNALTEAQFNVANGATAAAGGLTAYQTAMAKLDPVQQNFVKFLQSIGPQLSGLKSAATDSFLPLLQKAIETLLPFAPAVGVLLSTLGTGFGQLAVAAANALTGPFWTQFLVFVNTQLGPAIATFGQVFGGFFELGASVFQAAYPLIKEFGDALAGGLDSASKAVQGGALNGFFAYIQANGPLLKETLKTIALAVVSILKSFAADGPAALKAVSQIATDLAGLAKVVAPLVKDLLPFAPEILSAVIALKLLGGGPIGLVVAAGVVLGELLIELYQRSKTFRDVVNDIALFFVNDLPAAIDFVVGIFHDLELAVDKVVVGFETAYQDVTGFVSDIYNTVLGLPGKIESVAGDMLNAGVNLIQALGSGIAQGFTSVTGDATAFAKGIFNDLIGFINAHFIDPIKTFHVSFGPFGPYTPFGDIPDIQHLARGGFVVGQGSPTSDNTLIAASPGEFMVNARDAARNQGVLRAINNGEQVKSGDRSITVYEAFNATATAMAIDRRLGFAGA